MVGKTSRLICAFKDFYCRLAQWTTAYIENVHIFKKWKYCINHESRIEWTIFFPIAPFYDIDFKSGFIELLFL